MTRAVDLAQAHVKDALWRWRQAAFLATLMAATSCVAATDYPPPPGAYRSEPMTLPAMPQPSTADTSERHTAPQTGTSSMRLPIPQLAPSDQPGEYDAANLFGSAKTTSQTKGPDLLQPLSNRQTAPIEPAHAAEAEADADTQGLTLDFGHRDAAAPPRNLPRNGPAAPVYYGYPQYVPAHPAYEPHPNPGMYQGQPTIPAARYPGYPHGYVQGDPRPAAGFRGDPLAGPGISPPQALEPAPGNGQVPNDLQQQYRVNAADGTTFRAVAPDSSGEMDPAVTQGRGTPVSGEALIFRPPELLPGR